MSSPENSSAQPQAPGERVEKTPQLKTIEGVLDPDTGKPLLRSEQAKDGYYQYWFVLGPNDEPKKFFRSKEDGETPESRAELAIEVEQEHKRALGQPG
jgi:hypothetical protein